MAKANKGLRTYDGIEGVNLFLGQAGFDLSDSSTLFTGDYVGFQVIGDGTTTAKCEIAATSKVGDDIGTVSISSYEDIEAGSLVYGPFSEIKTGAHSSAIVLCYRG